MHGQLFPILIQPPEEEERDGRPEDAPERDEAVGVAALSPLSTTASSQRIAPPLDECIAGFSRR
jgi:hypothetical protein